MKMSLVELQDKLGEQIALLTDPETPIEQRKLLTDVDPAVLLGEV